MKQYLAVENLIDETGKAHLYRFIFSDLSYESAEITLEAWLDGREGELCGEIT